MIDEETMRRIDMIVDGVCVGGGINMDYKNYKIYAFPGSKVAEGGRAEHLPIHCHIKYPENELRVDCNTLEELSGKKIPKDLRKYLYENKSEIERRVTEFFSTGSYF